MSSSSLIKASPSGKRSRDLEDGVYLDNLQSNKRYLGEMMASSLNCLTVGDSSTDNIMHSPARSETIFYPRDDVSPFQYSPMCEDSDDAGYSEAFVTYTCASQADHLSAPLSPVSSPYRCQRLLSGWLSGSAGSVVSQPRQRGGSESESRFPSSPSDICHSVDLRRAALLRSVQMRAQLPAPSPFELPSSSGQNLETED